MHHIRVCDLVHCLGAQVRVLAGGGLFIDRQRGRLVPQDVKQELGQIQPRVPVTGVDRLLVGRARRLGLIPVQETAQLNQRVDIAGIA
jgi:hypothetical protein